MPRIALTELALRHLKPEGRTTYFDATTPGFALRATPGGARTFVIVHGPERARRWETIGHYPRVSLKEAREQARVRLAEIELGIKPEAPVMNFADAFSLFLITYRAKNTAKTVYEMERLVRRHLSPKLRHHAIGDITTEHLATLIEKLLPTPAECLALFTAARTVFKWAAGRRLITRSPLEGMQRPVRPATRDRVLSDAELTAVLRATSSDLSAFARIVQLLIFTGQRRSQIARLRVDYIDAKARTISWPSETMKSGTPHIVPYGKMAARILADLSEDGFVFGGLTGKPFNGFGKSKAAFDKRVGIQDWTLHDLRRTFATGLAILGVAPHLIERLLAHTSGIISGVAAIYNRHHFLPEMREALLKWEQHLAALLRAE
jgi:integrase